MPKKFNIFVSTVFITDGYTAGLVKKISRTSDLLKSNYANYEIVIVDNGLNLVELESVKKLLSDVPCIRIIRLAKISDSDTAIFAGVEASIGDYICTLYNNDPVDLVEKFVEKTQETDIVFGIAKNLKRDSLIERVGAKVFYWYIRKFLEVDIPKGSTYFMCINRNVANALTRTNRNIRHFRHLAKTIGFSSSNIKYNLPENGRSYNNLSGKKLVFKAIDIVANYSNHPLRAVTYFGLVAGILNLIYAIYVLFINISKPEVVEGWTTTSLQSSIMFFLLFIILAVFSEYIGKILVETRKEQPYHIMQELSSTVSLADETRRNVQK